MVASNQPRRRHYIPIPARYQRFPIRAGMIAAMVSHIPLDLDHLNPSQRAAVTHPPGPLLVVAGPGSGKTRVVTHRIAWLIQERDVAPWRILAVTFTNRAAKEMRNRLESLIGADAADDVWMGTFHRICVRMLRAHGESIGVPRNFAIFDRDDQIQVVRRALIDLYLDPKEYPPGAIINRISRAKSRGESRDSYHAETYFDEIAGRVWERYDAALKDAASLDFDDLLLRACDLFTLPAARQARETISTTVRLSLRRRVPGYEPRTVSAGEALVRWRTRQCDVGRRS